MKVTFENARYKSAYLGWSVFWIFFASSLHSMEVDDALVKEIENLVATNQIEAHWLLKHIKRNPSPRVHETCQNVIVKIQSRPVRNEIKIGLIEIIQGDTGDDWLKKSAIRGLVGCADVLQSADIDAFLVHEKFVIDLSDALADRVTFSTSQCEKIFRWRVRTCAKKYPQVEFEGKC